MTTFASLVLFCADLPRSLAFYRAAGIPLEDEEHDGGPVHAAVELDDVHIAIYSGHGPSQPAPGRRSIGSAFPGFYVESLDAAHDAVLATGARMIEQHEQMEWGCRIVAEDPDGRAIEIIQRDHCAGSP